MRSSSPSGSTGCSRCSRSPTTCRLENKRVTTSAIANAQGQVESQNFESQERLKYDAVMDRQRQVITPSSREVLEGADLEDRSPLHRRRRHRLRHRLAARVLEEGDSSSCGPTSARSGRSRCPTRTLEKEPAGAATSNRDD